MIFQQEIGLVASVARAMAQLSSMTLVSWAVSLFWGAYQSAEANIYVRYLFMLHTWSWYGCKTGRNLGLCGWVNYFAARHCGECLCYSKAAVGKKICHYTICVSGNTEASVGGDGAGTVW